MCCSTPLKFNIGDERLKGVDEGSFLGPLCFNSRIGDVKTWYADDWFTIDTLSSVKNEVSSSGMVFTFYIFYTTPINLTYWAIVCHLESMKNFFDF